MNMRKFTVLFFELEKAYDNVNWLELFCYDSVESWLLDAVRAI